MLKLSRRPTAFPGETKTSFQRDFERSDKADERDLFSGTIVRLGSRLGVQTPVTRKLQEMLNAKKPQSQAVNTANDNGGNSDNRVVNNTADAYIQIKSDERGE